MRAPSGEKAALSTAYSWPRSTMISWPVVASHSRAVRSAEAVMMRVPSGKKAALQIRSSWPRSVMISCPVVASHSRAVRSAEAVTIHPPSGAKDALAPGPGARQGGGAPRRAG